MGNIIFVSCCNNSCHRYCSQTFVCFNQTVYRNIFLATFASKNSTKMETPFIESSWFTYGLLPMLIFLARIIDVTLDTLRIIFVSRGNKVAAPILGFFGILIWLLAITRIMANLDNWTAYIAYAAGFAAGNYVALRIEEKLAIGIQIIRVITNREASPLITELRDKGYGVTVVDAEGKDGPVHVIFLVVKRQKVKSIIHSINHFNPKAFYSIEDVRSMRIDHARLVQGTKHKSVLSKMKRRV
jgi:uncharacterized protein YebE (UPF0316 family)